MNSHYRTGLSQDIQLQQKQGLVLTPALTQSLQILAMPALELAEFVQEQLEENPVLEVSEEHEELQSADNARVNYDETAAEEVWERLIKARNEEPGIYAPVVREEGQNRTLVAPEEEQLPSYLRLQLGQQQVSAEVLAAAEYIIEHLDEDGYLGLPLERMAEVSDYPESVLEEALTLVQSLEPAGVGARSLVECLKLQVSPDGPEAALVLAILDAHVEDLARNRVKETARALKVGTEQVEEAFAQIRALNPRPASLFGGGNKPVQYIIPDIFVRKVGEEYQVTLNSHLEPRLQVSHFYRQFDLSLFQDEDAKEYMKQKFNAAVSLIRNIEKRHDTVYRLAKIVVERQRQFLEQGLPGLAPLTMREVAEQAELHESTVSRAIAGKYIQTPRGVFEWKFFFPRAYDTGEGQVAPAWVKAQLLELIEAEDKKKPLSDSRLQELLAEQGIQVARRTVAKYREQLGIPAKSMRRR